MKVSWDDSRDRWRVSWEERKHTKRRFFKTKESATDFASIASDELKANGGEAWSALPAAARAELVENYNRAQAEGYSISEACRLFEQEGPRTTSRILLSDLARRFKAAKKAKNLRPQYLRILGLTIDQFLDGRETRQAASITTEEISDWINANPKWGPWRRRDVIIDIGGMFNWAIKNKLLRDNPLDGVEREIIDHETPVVLTVEECKRLLKLCRKSHKKLLPWLVISLFAGLRAAEVGRLHFENISGNYIVLASHQTKGRARRLVSVRPTLKAWLDICGKAKGPVCVAKHDKKTHALRKAFGGMARNVLRHSFISYALGAGDTVDKVATESGTSAPIIFRHYREIVTPEQAQEFWNLLP